MICCTPVLDDEPSNKRRRTSHTNVVSNGSVLSPMMPVPPSYGGQPTTESFPSAVISAVNGIFTSSPKGKDNHVLTTARQFNSSMEKVPC